MYKTFEYQVLVDVEFQDEFDPQYVRDALVFGYEKMMDEGFLTSLDDETTVCGQMSCVFIGAYEPDVVQVNAAPDLLHALQKAHRFLRKSGYNMTEIDAAIAVYRDW